VNEQWIWFQMGFVPYHLAWSQLSVVWTSYSTGAKGCAARQWLYKRLYENAKRPCLT
jgi:hypothetical protein